MQWGQDSAGARLQKGANGKGEPEDTEGKGGPMAQSKGTGTRPKAAPRPGLRSHTRVEEAEEEDQDDEEEEPMPTATVPEIPPPFTDPLPRSIQVGRIKALETKVAQYEADPTKGNRKDKAEKRLDEARTCYKEAGGGNPAKTCFALVNANKQLLKLEKLVERHQKTLEERGGEVHAALEAEKLASAELQKAVRERDNVKEKLAYLAGQTAQEAGQAVHKYEGMREAVECFRFMVQQTQQHALIPRVDILCQVANILDPPPYVEESDPLVQAVDISEESGSPNQSEASSPHDTDDTGGEEMDGVTEDKRGKKRRNEAWEDRGETAEARGRTGAKGRDGSEETVPEEALPALAPEEIGKEILAKKQQLRRDTERLKGTVEANAQIDEKERLQIQQDKEHEAIKAATEIQARLQGQVCRWSQSSSSGPPIRAPPNPRLSLDAARRKEATPAESGTSDTDGEGEMEVEGQKKKHRHRNRRRKSTSRTPRGRACHDTLD